jgi:hypothetical protein
MRVVRSEKEIDEVMNKAAEAMDNGSKFFGMSYEDGVRETIEWLRGDSEESPMEE